MTFEYKIEYYGASFFRKGDSSIENYLNKEGSQGWELVHIITKNLNLDPDTISNYRFYFKRKIES